MIKAVRKHSFVLLFLMYSIIIFISRIWYIRECNTLAIRNDEYGYWTHAALFSGHDWSDVFAGHMNWYSYGYSLALTPLFWLTHNLRIMYKAAIVLNGCFAVLSFGLCQGCAKILSPKTNRLLLLTVSFMVCMYASYITQGPVAWSESFLYLMVWLLMYLYARFETHPSALFGALLSLCVAGCYITHNRTIGIVAAYFLIVLFLRLTDAISWKILAAMLLPLVVILFLNVNIKTWLCIIEGFGLKPKNGLGAQKEHLLSLLTPDGWWNLIRSLGGQMWCLMTSTFGLLFWGLSCCASHVLRALRTRKAGPHMTFYLFTMTASAATFLVSAISLIDPASITNLDSDTDLSYFIYTRYDECIIGILLLLGFLYLAQHKTDLKLILLTAGCVILYAGMCVILSVNLQRITDTWHYRSFCAAGIGFYRLVSEEFSMGWCTLIGSTLFFILFFMLLLYKRQYRKRYAVTACLILTAVFIPTGLYSAWIGTITSQLGKVSCGNLGMYYQLKDVAGNRKIYCTLDDTDNFRIAYELQVNLIDNHVYSITLEDLPVKEEDYFICCSNGDLNNFHGNDYYLLAQSDAYAVLVKGDGLADEVSQASGQNLKHLPLSRNDS